jgi:hypothetical protein
VQRPPWGNARPPTLPGVARGCPLLVVRPLPPRRVAWSMLPSTSCNRRRQPAAYKCHQAARSGKLHTPTSFYSPKRPRDFATIRFICFRCMLQVIHMNVAKVDQDVAHVAAAVHVCCKHLFQIFHLFFFIRILQVCLFWNVVYISHICCICFILMLHMFCNDIFKCFLQVFQKHVSSVSSVFSYMLQMFHLDVSKVDRVLLLGTHLL